ncbi:MAG: TetR/AcrR family transcriptional regulator [Nakamurella sp.]
MSETRQRRSYNATGRQLQANANRERILDVARQLFVTGGYAGTAVADIAAAAGVSVPTVFARFGSKVKLFKECIDTATVGDAEPVPLAERAEMVHVRAGTTAQEVIGRLAALIATAGPRVVPIYLVMYAAADADPDIRALARELDQQRLIGATQLARVVVNRLGTDDEELLAELRDVIWTVNSAQTYGLLAIQRGWSGPRYERWVRSTLLAVIHEPGG